MGFQKGTVPNPKGRPKGSQNKSVIELRAVLQAAFEDEIINIPQMLNELETEKRLEMLAKFIGYVLPKPIEQVSAGAMPESIQPPNVTFISVDMSNNNGVSNDS